MKAFLIVIGIIAILAWVTSFVLMFVWNWVVPSVFNGPVITQWQAFGICVLLNIIGSFFRSSNSSRH